MQVLFFIIIVACSSTIWKCLDIFFYENQSRRIDQLGGRRKYRSESGTCVSCQKSFSLQKRNLSFLDTHFVCYFFPWQIEEGKCRFSVYVARKIGSEVIHFFYELWIFFLQLAFNPPNAAQKTQKKGKNGFQMKKKIFLVQSEKNLALFSSNFVDVFISYKWETVCLKNRGAM